MFFAIAKLYSLLRALLLFIVAVNRKQQNNIPNNNNRKEVNTFPIPFSVETNNKESAAGKQWDFEETDIPARGLCLTFKQKHLYGQSSWKWYDAKGKEMGSKKLREGLFINKLMIGAHE